MSKAALKTAPASEPVPSEEELLAEQPIAEDPIKPILAPARLTEHCGNSWTIYPGNDVDLDDIENPVLWSVAGRMWKAGDEVRVITNEAFILLLVTREGALGANVATLYRVKLVPPECVTPNQIPEGYEIRLAEPGSLARFAVIRKLDGRQINKNETTHTDYQSALTWLLQHAVFKPSPVRRR